MTQFVSNTTSKNQYKNYNGFAESDLYTDTKSNTYTYTKSDTDTYTDNETDPDPYTDSDSDSDSDSEQLSKKTLKNNLINYYSQPNEVSSNETNRIMKIVNKKFDIPADALDYFYHCKYFSPNTNVYIKLTKEMSWFPKDISQAKLMAKSWSTSLKERNKMFSKCSINIMFDFYVRAINFQLKTK
jgi:hypothetical protein